MEMALLCSGEWVGDTGQTVGKCCAQGWEACNRGQGWRVEDSPSLIPAVQPRANDQTPLGLFPHL